MKKPIVLIIITFLLTACGSGDKGSGSSAKSPNKVSNPWMGLDASLPGNVVEGLRLLEFSDDLGISYDERDANGGEEVCRRKDEDGEIFEVCMPLEDDPYFVALENNSFVWHPLMFERFATELNCYIYMKEDVEAGGVKSDEDCWADVFPAMGGEDFYCEAGLFNGDKALKCSDDWAVAINGDDNDTKAVCRIHLDTGSGRCLAAPKDGFADAELILNMQRTVWDGYRSRQDNNQQFAAGDSALPLIPQDIPAGAKLTYRSDNEDICTVDDDDSDGGMGMVTIDGSVTPPEVCKIFLLVEAKGFADRVLFVELPILEASDVEWSNYIRNNNYFYPGETLDAGPINSTTPSLNMVESEFLSLNETICTVDENGTVTALQVGECVIRLTATAEGFLDVVIDRTIPIDPLETVFVDILWTDFDALDAATAVVGADVSAFAAAPIATVDSNNDGVLENASGATLSYEVTGDCTYDEITRVISFSGITECVVEVTAFSSERNEASFAKEFRFTPGLASFDLTWTGYGSSGNAAEFGSPAPALDAPATNPADLGAEYSYVAVGGGCEVDAESGALTIVGADGGGRSCEVVLSASRDGYEVETLGWQVVISKKPQADLVVVNPPYGQSLSLALDSSISLTVINPPTGGVGNVDYRLQDPAGSCAIDDETGEVTVRTGVTPSDGDTCVVDARWKGDENNAPSANWTSNIATIYLRTPQVMPTWSSDPYGNNPTAHVDAPLNIVNAPNGTTGAPEYRSNTEDVCTVDYSTGAVTGVAVGDCELQFRFVGTGNVSGAAASDWSGIYNLNVDKGEHPSLTGSDYYGTGPEVSKAGTLALVTAPEGYGAATYTIKGGLETYCSVGESTGVVRGIAKTSSATDCVIQVAFAGDDNYNASAAMDLQSITVLDQDQNITIANPYGANLTMAVGEIKGLINVPTATIADGSNGGDITYHLTSSTASGVCELDAEGTISALKPGKCGIEIQVTAVAGYNSATKELATITVETGRFSFRWNPYPEDADYRAGGEGEIVRVRTGSTGADVSYTVADEGETGCAFKGSSGVDEITLSFDSYGVCTIRATATKEYFEDWVQERGLRVRPGKISVVAGQFLDSDTLVVGSSQPKTPSSYSSLDPSTAEVTWQLIRGEKDCYLQNEITGAVVALPVPIEDETNPPMCSLQLVARKKNYDTFKSDLVEIPLARGVMGTLTGPVYGSGVTTTLPVGGYLDITEVPSESNDLPIAPVNFVVTGTESNGSTLKSDVCDVFNDDPTSPHFGRVTAGSAAAAGDKCKVLVSAESPGYQPKDAPEIVLTVVDGNLEFGTELNPEPVITFEGELKVGAVTEVNDGSGTNYLDVSTLPENYNVDEDSTLAITWNYQAQALYANGDDHPMACTIDINNNDVLLNIHDEAQVGGHCLVTAIAVVADYGEYEIELAIPFVAGDLIFADNSENKSLYSGTLRVGGLVSANTEDNVDDQDVSVTWGDWRVLGLDSNEVEKEGVCSVNGEGLVRADSEGVAGDICKVYAVSSAQNYNDSEELEVASLTLAAKVTLGSVTAPVYTEDLTVRGLPVGFSDAPEVTGAGADEEITWTYEATGKRAGTETEDICSANGDGAVIPGSAAEIDDTCEVVATANVPGYISKSATAVTLTVKDTFTSLTWANFPTQAAVGTDINLTDNQPISVPAATPVISTESSDCSYDVPSKTLSFSDSAECRVKVAVSKSGYIDYSQIFRVTPSSGAIAVSSWGSYSGVKVGAAAVDAPSLTGANPSNPESEYALATDSIGCNVDDAGAVEGTGAGTGACKVVRTLSKTGYEDLEHIYAINVAQGDQNPPSFANDPYGATPNVDVDGTLNLAVSKPTGEGDLEFGVKSTTTGYCTVVPGTGEVRGANAGAGKDCTIQAKFVANDDYTESSLVDVATIAVNKIPQTFPDWSNPYGANPSVDMGNTKAISAAHPSGHGTLVFQVAPGDENYCDVDGNGLVTPEAEGVTHGSCDIQAQFDGDSTNAATDWTLIASVGVNVGTITVTWGTYSTVKVGAETDSPISGLDPADADASYTTDAASVGCTVNEETGAVTGTAVGTNTCIIDVVLSADGYTDLEDTYTFNIELGEQTVSWNNAYGDNPSITVGEGGISPTGAHPTSQGTLRFRVAPTSNGYCDVDGTSGLVTPLTAGAGEDCVIEASFASTTQYDESDWGEIGSIDVNHGTIAGVSWTLPYSARVGQTITLPSATGLGGGTDTYNESSDACTLTGMSLTFDEVGSCIINLRVQRTGYNDFTGSHSINVSPGSQTLSWANPYTATTVAVGTTVDPVSPPSNPASGGGNMEYQVKPNGGDLCTVDDGNGRVTPKATSVGGSCVIQARYADNDNYNASGWVEDTIQVTVGTIPTNTVGWSPTQSTGEVGTPLRLDAVTTGVVEGDVLSYDVISGDCTFGNGNPVADRTLTFTGTTDCVVTGSIERVGYNKWTSNQHTITVTEIPAITGLSWTRLIRGGRNFKVGTDITLNSVAGTQDGDSVSYSVISGNCSFGSDGDDDDDTAERTLSATNPGDCNVLAKVERSGHRPWYSGIEFYSAGRNTSATNQISLEPIAVPGMDSASLSTDGVIEVTKVPTSVTIDGQTYTNYRWEWRAIGLDSNYNVKSNVCEVNSNSLTINGRFTAGTDAIAGDTCLIVATFIENTGNYLPVEVSYEFSIKNTQLPPDTGLDTYDAPAGGSEVNVYNGNRINVDVTHNNLPRGGGGVGSIVYRTTDSNICTVGGNDGLLTIGSGSGVCTVQVRWTTAADASVGPSPWVELTTVLNANP